MTKAVHLVVFSMISLSTFNAQAQLNHCRGTSVCYCVQNCSECPDSEIPYQACIVDEKDSMCPNQCNIEW